MKNPKNKVKKLKAIELFAGVGGFRQGLESEGFKIVWSNQWEPATKKQHASDVYIARYGSEGHSNEDISTVHSSKIPDHDILTGGFPCQDYSVAKSLSQAKGIHGKKGVLWWQIHRILEEKKVKPGYLLLENVDRLLKSPADQRGRDFAIMLASLSDLGYCVEWRVINAADYGFPQRRRRVYILGYHKKTGLYKQILKNKNTQDWLHESGVIAKAFPVKGCDELFIPGLKIEGDLPDITENFNDKAPHISPFLNTGIIINRVVTTRKTYPDFHGKKQTLSDVLLPSKKIQPEFYIDMKDLKEWEYLKGAKHILKKSTKTGKTFKYDEGGMVFPDPIDKPSRTIITGEGGSSPSRFKHVVRDDSGRLRRLTPIELERLNMFPDDHTKGVPDQRRAFFMGNAVVVGVLKGISKSLVKAIKQFPK